jgi:NADH:ubiquinone oxidoreductase subunit 2 (subunit N)
MNALTPAINYLSLFLGLLGALLLFAATYKAARASKGFDALSFMTLAGLGYVLLGLAAGIRAPESLGLRASMTQLVSVIAAALLGLLCSQDGKEETGPGSRSLAAVGLFLCWFSLIGLPPTLGFHGKLLVYRSLLQAGWTGLFWLALLGTGAALLPGFQALTTARPRMLKRGQAALAIILITVLLGLGIYPGALTDLLAHLVK